MPREYIDNDGYYKFDRMDDQLNRQTTLFTPIKTAEWDDPEGDLGGFTVKDNRPVSDPIVQAVMDKFKIRHFQGMKTYGVTLAENKASILEWINHAQEECMDQILYLERLKQFYTGD